ELREDVAAVGADSAAPAIRTCGLPARPSQTTGRRRTAGGCCGRRRRLGGAGHQDVRAARTSVSNDRSSGELREDVAAVRLERLFLAVRHQVDVELVDADRLELAQLLRRLLRRPEDAEAVADLVGDELAVLRADAAVVLV